MWWDFSGELIDGDDKVILATRMARFGDAHGKFAATGNNAQLL